MKQLEPANADADAQLRELAVLQRAEAVQSKAMFTKMFK